MSQPLPAPGQKSTVEEIRRRFDGDVERFSNLDTGQAGTIDAPLVLDLIAQAAVTVTPGAKRMLDVGCGAGNYALKLLERLPLEEFTLIDLSQPMLERARQRVSEKTSAAIRTVQADVRELPLERDHYDLVTAAAVLHHLRTDDEWRDVFTRLYQSLRPGGSLWIADLIEHSQPAVQSLMWGRYEDYLTALGGREYCQKVVNYVNYEDTPKPLMFQLDLLRSVGFRAVDVLHKNSVFAAFGATR